MAVACLSQLSHQPASILSQSTIQFLLSGNHSAGCPSPLLRSCHPDMSLGLEGNPLPHLQCGCSDSSDSSRHWMSWSHRAPSEALAVTVP